MMTCRLSEANRADATTLRSAVPSSNRLGLTALLGAILVLVALAASAQSSVTLAWDPSSGTNIAGYHLYQGGASGSYTNVIPAGNATNATASGLASSATYFFAVTAYDATGLESAFSNEITYTVPTPTNAPPAGTTVTLWPSTAVPTTVDAGADNAVELGVQFTSDVAGSITGIRFYKSSANTGTHVGNLWSSTGTLLATATFTSETASGWQQVNFATPVTIAANTIYVASYHVNGGHFSDDASYFAANGVDNAPLHAPNNSVAGGNGVYAYGASSTFPNQTWNSCNYWVDVVWQAQAAPITLTSVAVTPTNPSILAGATQQFTATGTYSDGSTQNLTSQATWASSSMAVATVNAAGLATSVSAGTTTVSAALNGVTGSSTLTVTINPPTIALTSPTTGASYTAPASVPLTATVTANGHTITKVQFYNGTTLLGQAAAAPYTFNWANVSAGSYSLAVQAVYDAGSTVASAPANVTVTTPSPPSIALTAPVNGANYTAPAAIPLAAAITANGHTITTVQYYNGATLLGQAASAPYSFTWSNVSSGGYSLTARAVYDAGSTVASTPANVTVANASSSGTLTFSNPSAITIPDSGAGTPYPSTINVSGMSGLISNLTLTLANLSHTWVSDVDVLLVGPAGQQILVLANVGDAFVASNVTVTLSDAATSTLPSSGAFVTGTYQPTAYAPVTTFPSPAPSGPYATTLSTLNGQPANGTWSLYVFDDGPGDQGSFAGGWSLTVTTVSTTGAAPTISAIPNQSITANTATPAIPFTVNDTDTPVASLTLSGGSSNPTLVPTSNILFGGSGSNRTVTVSPAANQTGTATITVSVSDGTSSANATFVLTVNAVTPPPTVALTSPANGASYTAPAAINLAAAVTANGHTITKVQFYNGATLLGQAASAPYTLTWSNVSAGSYSLTAQAVYDSGSTVVSTPANVTVTNLPLPFIALTAPVSGASYAAPATIPLAASIMANSHTITKVQFYNGATLLGQAAAAPYTLTWTNVGSGSYSLTAQVVYDAGSTVSSAPVNLTVTGLPAPWQTADIGSVGVAGSASIAGGLYTVAGAGQISGSADSFRFLYQPMSGDGKIDASVSAAQNTGSAGSIGVMIRESLTSGSQYAFMGISPDGTFRWQSRSGTGGNTSSTSSGAGRPPNSWARLVRTGSTFYGYKSTNGTNWTLVNSRSITMATNIYVGFAVASGTSNVLNSSTFTNVTVVP